MIIDLTCPIELTAYEINYDDLGSAEATLELFNLSDKTITGYNVTVACEKNKHRANQNFSISSLMIEGGFEFKLKIPLQLKHVKKFDIIIQSVAFNDGTVWRSEGGALVDTCALKPITGKQLDEFQTIAGEDACFYPEMQNNFWRCVCGRINSMSDEVCFRCRRERDYVLKDLNRHILTTDKKTQKQRNKRERKAVRSSSRALERTRRRCSIALIASVAIFLLTAMYICAFIHRTGL